MTAIERAATAAGGRSRSEDRECDGCDDEARSPHPSKAAKTASRKSTTVKHAA